MASAGGPGSGDAAVIPRHEVAAAIVLSLLPLATYVLALLVTRAFDPRYVLNTVFGVALLLAYLVHGAEGRRPRYAQAVASYERAVARRPSYWQAINNLAIVFNNTGQHGRAYRWMREAVRLDPARATTRANFGELLRAMGFAAIVLLPTAIEPRVSYRAHAIGFALGAAAGTLFFGLRHRRLRAAEQVHWE